MLKKIFATIEKKEWKLIFLVVVFLILITIAPLIYGWLARPANSYFMGFQSVNLVDFSVYYSYIEQVRQGDFLFKNLFTSSEQLVAKLNIFWLALGFLSKIFNLSSVLTFQLARILLLPLLVFSGYFFIAYFFGDKLKRRLSFLLLAFSSGLGFWFSFLNSSIDFWVPEANFFFTIYHSPHFIFSLTLLIWIFLLMFFSFESGEFKYSIWAGILALVLFQFHPYHVLTVFLVLLTYWSVVSIKNLKINRTIFKQGLIFCLIFSPSILYYLWLLKNDWLTLAHAKANVCLMPSFSSALVGYGLVFFLAITGLIKLFKSRSLENKFLFLIVWFLSQSFLIYFPINFQRRLTEGLQIPMVILSVVGLFWLYNFLKEKFFSERFDFLAKNKILLSFLFILLFCFSNIYIILTDIYFYKKNAEPFYINGNKYQALQWVKNNTKKEDSFLLMDNYFILPALSGRSVYLGHKHETPFWRQKQRKLEWFFGANREDEEKKDFLKKNNIDYLYFTYKNSPFLDAGPKAGPVNFRAERKAFLKKVFENQEVLIFKTNLDL